MWIHFNGAARYAARQLLSLDGRLTGHFRRLSSGLRITRAADDPSGLAISERMRANLRSIRQSLRNTQDAISVTQVMDAALDGVSAMLHRAVELAVQAGNGTFGEADREYLQLELTELVAEIARTGTSTRFNGRPLFRSSDDRALAAVEGLRKSWLRNAEALVTSAFGLTPSGTPSLKIVLDDTASHPAFVRGTIRPDGRYDNLELHLNLSAFDNFDLPNGGSTAFHVDRLIAHEMTHAIMSQTMNFAALPQWFKEGAAEFIAGADDRLAADLAAAGNDPAAIVARITSWGGTSADYSAGYAAVKYLHNQITSGSGIRDVMQALAGGATLDAAINTLTGGAYADASDFLTDFQSAAGGQAFISSLDLVDADVGGIGGGDAETVVPDTETDTWDPLTHFAEIWPTSSASFQPLGPAHVGPGAHDKIPLPEVTLSLFELGLGGLDLVGDSTGAIAKLYGAIDQISAMRARVGATANRLEHSLNVGHASLEALTAAESRIRDLDMAQAMSEYTRDLIRMQAASAMLAQANVLHRQSFLALLTIK